MLLAGSGTYFVLNYMGYLGPKNFRVKELKPGDNINFPKLGDKVTVNYTESLINGKVVESSI